MQKAACRLVVCFSFILLFASCSDSGPANDSKDPDNGSKLPVLEYVGKLASLSAPARSMDVASDGTVFIMPATTYYGQPISVLRPGSSSFVAFTDKSSGAAVSGTAFCVDASDLVNVFVLGSAPTWKRLRYEIDGTLHDERNLYPPDTLAFNIPQNLDNGIAMDAAGNTYILGTNSVDFMSGEVAIMKLAPDLTQTKGMYNYVFYTMATNIQRTKARELDGIFTGIAVAPDGTVLVTADNYIGSVDDGILAMDSNLDKIAWHGGDDSSNAPCDVAVDSNGNIYVVNSGDLNVQVYDSSWKRIAATGADGAADKLEKPALVDVVGDLVYVVDCDKTNSAYALHAFKAVGK